MSEYCNFKKIFAIVAVFMGHGPWTTSDEAMSAILHGWTLISGSATEKRGVRGV
jgi:hypothetical protein